MTDLLEKDFTDNVVQLAKTLGWRVAHFRPAQTKQGWRTAMQGDKGFPDLVLAKAGRVIFAELKSATGKVSKEQQEWLDELTDHQFTYPQLIIEQSGKTIEIKPGPGEVYVWRPDDIDEIGKVLGPNA